MKPVTGIAVLAAGWLAAGVTPAQAAWDNVFQTCCNSCKSQSQSYYFAPAPAWSMTTAPGYHREFGTGRPLDMFKPWAPH